MANVRFHRALLAATAAGLLLCACKPKDFDVYEEQAAIRVHGVPKKYGSQRYGAVIATYHGPIGGAALSRAYISGGQNSPVAIARAWSGTSVGESALLRCATLEECRDGVDFGETIIPFGDWGGETTDPRRGCVFMPTTARNSWVKSGELGATSFVLCESHVEPQYFNGGLTDVRDGDGDLQFDGFGLPKGHPAGVVMLGVNRLEATTSARRNGGVYVQADRNPDDLRASVLEQVVLNDPESGAPFTLENAGDLGRQVRGATYDDGELVVAVSQPSRKRVLVISYDPAAPGRPAEKFISRACIESPDADIEFGAKLALGDVDGDRKPELFIGSDPTTTDGKHKLYMYRGRGLPARASGSGCAAWGEAAVEVRCPNVEDLGCEEAGFGAAFAVGDFDADGHGDLIVGAPYTSVAGLSEAGAAYIFPGSDDGLVAGEAIALTQPAQRGHFGWAVAALHTQDRDEPVIGAPGREEAYVFMCTELEAGFGGTDLCLSK